MKFLKTYKKPISTFSVIAIIGFIVFLSITFIMHFIQPDYDASKKYISEFIHCEYGWLLNIAIAGNLIGCGAFTIAFFFFTNPINPEFVLCVCA